SDIFVVLGREGWQVDAHPRQVDMPAVAELAGGEHFALDAVVELRQHLPFNRTVIDYHGVADGNVFDEILVIYLNGVKVLALFTADSEGEFLPGLQVECGWQVARANGWSLGIHEYPGVPVSGGGGGPDVLDHAAHPVPRRVGHVEAKNIHAGILEPA